MSQPNPKYSDFDFALKRERRGPSPITNLPVNALSDEVDPTKEIRTLINELQNTARDASTRVQAVEEERDNLAAQLEHAFRQIEQFRQQFTEVSNLLRERDAAVEAADRAGRHIKEVERKVDTLSRERNDAQRQRDDAMRQRDDAMRQRDEAVNRRHDTTRQAQEAASHLAEVQRQVISIRQARDSAQAHNHELSTKCAKLQDELAEFHYTRESLEKSAEKAQADLAEAQRKVETLAAERDASSKRADELQAELDEQRRKVLNLTEEKSAVAMADSEHSAALAEARQQVLSLSQERDAARHQAQEHSQELEELRQQFHALREEQQENPASSAELEALQRQVATLLSDRDEQLMREQEFFAETASQQERLATLTEQVAAAQRGREEALTSLTAAQKQIDHIIRDRDQVRQQSIDRSLEMEAQIAAIRTQMAELEKRTSDADRRINAAARERDDALVKAEQFEKQRLQSIDLAAQLDAARRDLMKLGADLAEARLQVKFAQAGKSNPARAAVAPPPLPPAEPITVEITLDAPPAPAPAPAPEERAPAVPAPLPSPDEPLTERDAKSMVAAMKHCLQSFTKNAGDMSLLNELYCQAHCFAERARVSNFVALHRLGSAFSWFVQELYKFPELLNPSAMRTLNQSIDFLGVLLKQKDYAALSDPAKAVVYAVDDDVDNSNAIKMAMETVMIRTQCAQEPAVALAELASGRFDLIFLDVNLPHMDGFELCQQIRQLAIHARTPIVFLTGLTTVENRVQSSLSGANEFIGKPFNLHELSVKALTLILKSSLNME